MTYWGDYDEKITAWAASEKGLFVNQENANSTSSNLIRYLRYEMYGSILFTPSMNQDGNFWDYLFSKTKGTVVVYTGEQIPVLIRNEMALSVGRLRPNEASNTSFPSGHATDAGTRNIITGKNLDAIEMDPDLRTGIKTINTTMAAVTMWSRLEANKHYPSDVLAGYALAAFFGGFIYDSLMNYDPNESFALMPLGDRIFAQYSFKF